jgi:hypothetical protein
MRCAVHDQANRKDGSYWQWASHPLDARWEAIARAAYAGWPMTSAPQEPRDEELYGIADTSDDAHWLYRAYPAGRDGFGRPGRCFLVIFQLDRPADSLDPRVAGVFNYFAKERALPLNCSVLEGEMPRAIPDPTLQRVAAEWQSGEPMSHCGIDGNGHIRRFSAISEPTARPRRMGEEESRKTERLHEGLRSPDTDPMKPHWQSGHPIAVAFGCGAVIGLAAGVIVAKYVYDAPRISQSRESQETTKSLQHKIDRGEDNDPASPPARPQQQDDIGTGGPEKRRADGDDR